VKVVIFGASGMIGQGVLRESLLASDVEQVLAVVRTPTGVRHPKLREAALTDFTDLTPLTDQLAGYTACFYCLGVSVQGRTEAEYTRISYDYPVAAARALATINPDMTFVYVSGAGTDPQSRAMWARVKGRAEQAILEIFPNGYAFRPGFIRPTYGATSRTRLYRVVYALTAPVLPLFERLAPRYVTSSDRLGRAMLRAAREGVPQRIVEGRDLRRSRGKGCYRRTAPWSGGTTSSGCGGGGGVPSPNGRPPSRSRPCSVSQPHRSGPAGTMPVGLMSLWTT